MPKFLQASLRTILEHRWWGRASGTAASQDVLQNFAYWTLGGAEPEPPWSEISTEVAAGSLTAEIRPGAALADYHNMIVL